MNKIILICLMLVAAVFAEAQPPSLSTTNKGAIRSFEEGLKHYDSGNISKAKASLMEATQKDPEFIEAWTVLGELSAMANRPEEAITYYSKAVAINPAFHPNSILQLGKLRLMTGDYKNARTDFEQFLKLGSNATADSKRLAETYIASCHFAEDALQHPVAFSPVNLGKGVNSPMNEYFPSLTIDQKELVFTREIIDLNAPGGHQEDLYISKLKDSTWQTAKSAGGPLNSPDNEGAPTISADGRVMFLTLCNRPEGAGSCDIYFSQRLSDASWSKPVNIGAPVNTSAWESQPSFSSDGKTLYFIRGYIGANRKRHDDIFYSVFGTDMKWSEPVKLSDTINTPEIEESVFIHPDNQTLYFSSEGHPGMGGVDIYVSHKLENGSWGIPVNLGYPINTFNNENSLLVAADGKLAFFASNREGGEGGLDIYRFELPPSGRALMVSYARAIVTDAATGTPLAAKFEIIDVESGKVIISNSTDKRKGEFLAALPAGKNYMLNVDKEGYLFYSDYFELKEARDKQKAYELKIALNKPVAGEKVILRNIFFDVNKFDLKQESNSEVTRLASFLKNNPAVKIEISGHTDSTGDKKANQLLSENRAKSVMNALIEKGIATSRMNFKGYGDSKPVASNDTDEGRAQNRRTEVTVL